MDNKEKIYNLYITNLLNLMNQFEHKIISQECFHRLKYLNLKWFEEMSIMNGLPYKEIYAQDLDEELKKQYDTEENFPLCSLIYYRDSVIPCYHDDYGQQMFAKIFDKEVNGGAYNTEYAMQFIHEFDYLWEDKFTEDTLRSWYDEHSNDNRE